MTRDALRTDENGIPDDAAMRAFVDRLAALAPEARDAVFGRMWDGRRSREQLARAVEELRSLMPWPARANFEWACRPVILAWSGPTLLPLLPPWIGAESWRTLGAAGYDGLAAARGWSSNSVVLATAAVYHRAALSRASLALLYYPFEAAVPLASLDASIGALPDPLASDGATPPRMPPARLATIDRIVSFVRNAPVDALEDLVSEFAQERGMMLAVGDGAAELAERELKAALARTGLADEATPQVERVRDALRARDDAFHLPDPEKEPGVRITQDAVILVGIAVWAVQATIVGEALDESSRGHLTHTLLEHVGRHEREVSEGRRPAARTPTRPPRRLDAPVAARVASAPDAVVMVLGVRVGGRVVHLLVESRIMGISRGFMRAPDGSLPAFAAVEDARAHVREYFPPPRGLPRDLVRTLEGVGDPIDLDRVRAMSETGWEREWRLDEVEEVWAILAYAGELPALAGDGPVTGLAARLRETRVAYDEARRPKPRPEPSGERGGLFVRAAPAPEPPPPPSPWAVGATTWSAEDLAALRRTLQQRVDDLAARIRVV